MIGLSEYIKEHVYEGILDDDDKVISGTESHLSILCEPDKNCKVNINIKDWVKYATLEQYMKVLDSPLENLRRVRGEYDDTRIITLQGNDGYLTFRFFKRTRGGGRGIIHCEVALTKKPLPYKYILNDEFVIQREKMKNWDFYGYLPTGTTRKQIIQRLRIGLQQNLDNLFIQ